MKKQMKAMVINAYGSSEVLEEASIDIPKMGKNKILVEVHGAGVNPLDWKIRRGMVKFLTGKRFPKVLGSDVSGVVREVGGGVKGFKSGDKIYAMINCFFNQGGYAEYAVVNAKYTCKKPGNLSFIEAAAVPASAVTALQVLRDHAQIKKGQHILVNGSSGGVGTFSVQIAKIFGAHVTAVCSGKNAASVSSLGADHVIDYTLSDFTKENKKYDMIFDTVGNLMFADCKRVLSSGGAYITIVPNVKKILLTLFTFILPGKKCKFVSVKPNAQDLSWLKEEIEENKIKPVIGRVYPLDKAKEAMTSL